MNNRNTKKLLFYWQNRHIDINVKNSLNRNKTIWSTKTFILRMIIVFYYLLSLIISFTILGNYKLTYVILAFPTINRCFIFTEKRIGMSSTEWYGHKHCFPWNFILWGIKVSRWLTNMSNFPLITIFKISKWS